jgi:hypothetical protein
MDLDEEFITDQDAEITSPMLNITADARIVYDPDGKLASFFAQSARITVHRVDLQP